MKKFGALVIGVGVAVLALGMGTQVLAQAKKANCKTHYGRGWAPTVDMAKFQAWEIIAQTTGNWPFMSDKFTNERYTCKPDGSQIRCESKIDVCKS